MRELGMVLVGCFIFVVFFTTMIYPDIEYKNHPNTSSCTGMCYAEYIELNGNVAEQIQKKKEIAIAKAESGIVDEFETIRGTWAGCGACHGPDGGGGIGPKLAGQTADYISGRLISYKNKEKIGSQSAMMWGQAGMLSDADIQIIGKFIQKELK
jgi:cytochrome c553